MKVIRTRKLTPNFVEVDPILLEENSRTRRRFLGQLAKDANGVWNVRGTFVVERKSKEGLYPTDETTIENLKAGELAKLELKTEHVKRLISGLQVLANAAEVVGTTLRSTELVVGKKDEIVRVVERDHKAVIEHLIAEKHSKDFWNSLISLQPDVAAQLADAAIQMKRRQALSVFEIQLEKSDWKESDWERFFVDNQWIFGYGLRY
jgi:hypothetical protein